MTDLPPKSSVYTADDGLVGDLFRREAGRMVARLARHVGTSRLALAEDAVQDALLKAVAQWPFTGTPDRPAAWLWRVARNAAIDRLRRETTIRQGEPELAIHHLSMEDPPEPVFPEEISDDRLALIFACCHPDIAAPARLALTLKTACGFGVSEIATGLLTAKATVAQRLVRARRRLKQGDIAFATPPPPELPTRLRSVLDTIYLLFNEGFAATEGGDLLRRDLCEEAIRLATAVADHPRTNTAEAQALAALLLFQGARLDTRVDGQGDIILMPDQDRRRWDKQRIAMGFQRLQMAQTGHVVSEYHQFAGIAACHACAPSFEETDWRMILRFYDCLPQSAINRLNRSVAIAMTDGPKAALDEIEKLKSSPDLRRYYLLPATEGTFRRQLGQDSDAEKCFRDALALASSEPTRRFLRKKLA